VGKRTYELVFPVPGWKCSYMEPLQACALVYIDGVPDVRLREVVQPFRGSLPLQPHYVFYVSDLGMNVEEWLGTDGKKLFWLYISKWTWCKAPSPKPQAHRQYLASSKSRLKGSNITWGKGLWFLCFCYCSTE